MRDGAPCGKELLGEEWNVTGNGKQGKDGLVRVDGGYEQRCKVSSGLGGVQVGTITRSAGMTRICSRTHLSAYSLILLCANPKIWSTYSSLSG